MTDLLNLGCGTDYDPRATNVDVDPSVDPDVVHDLDETPWPFEDDDFSHARARHVLEHLADPLAALKELCRVVKPRGTVELTYPIGHTRFEDATHRQFWHWHTAEMLAGERNHGHEVDVPLSLVDVNREWSISHAEPLVRAYVRYRRVVSGDGPWLEQIPGVHGEVMASYRVTA